MPVRRDDPGLKRTQRVLSDPKLQGGPQSPGGAREALNFQRSQQSFQNVLNLLRSSQVPEGPAPYFLRGPQAHEVSPITWGAPKLLRNNHFFVESLSFWGGTLCFEGPQSSRRALSFLRGPQAPQRPLISWGTPKLLMGPLLIERPQNFWGAPYLPRAPPPRSLWAPWFLRGPQVFEEPPLFLRGPQVPGGPLIS